MCSLGTWNEARPTLSALTTYSTSYNTCDGQRLFEVGVRFHSGIDDDGDDDDDDNEAWMSWMFGSWLVLQSFPKKPRLADSHETRLYRGLVMKRLTVQAPKVDAGSM